MKLTISSRSAGKSTNKQIRREGNIPAILYSRGQPGEQVVVQGQEYSSSLKKIKPGCLSTTVFTLVRDGKEVKAILKDIQYNIINYNVIHLDFEELVENVPVNINVPLQCTGVVDCVGVKLGGILRQVIRSIRVKCLPENIPSEFSIDVRELGISQTRRLSDIEMPQGVRPLTPLNEVAVVIAKR